MFLFTFKSGDEFIASVYAETKKEAIDKFEKAGFTYHYTYNISAEDILNSN